MKGQARFICPACRGDLAFDNEGIRCTECGREFATSQGYADFTLGERFLDDRENPGLWDIEERTGRHLAEQYLQGLLTRLFPGRPRGEIRVLSIGCGVGSDVEALCDLGFDAYGIDPGGRTELWKRRPHSDRYFLANAKKLPFPDGDFDFAFLCCVLTHIGTVGASGHVQPDFEAQRAEAAGEAARVVRHDGYVMLSGPNPRFPLDLWHRPNLHSPRPRVHRPGERFCLSLADYRNYLLKQAGCQELTLLPVTGYWGFFQTSKSWFGRLLQLPVKFLFGLVSRPGLRALRGSPLNPWLVVLARR